MSLAFCASCRIRDSESCAELLLERMDTSDINFKDSGGRLVDFLTPIPPPPPLSPLSLSYFSTLASPDTFFTHFPPPPPPSFSLSLSLSLSLTLLH